MALGSTQPLTEMSTMNLPGGKERPGSKADKATTTCEAISRENLWASTSHNPIGLHGMLEVQLYLIREVIMFVTKELVENKFPWFKIVTLITMTTSVFYNMTPCGVVNI
jgi:hypothetical protein